MGQLALGVVGGVAGFFIGGPLGAQIGFALGSALGSVLFGEDTTIEGSRASDLAITSSTLGRPLPIIYGTYRTGGNLIYGKEIREVRTEEDQDKKGGKGSTVVSYSYFGTGAVAVCEGEATVLTIWADNKPIYDTTGNTPATNNKYQGKLRFYTGTETQDPDFLIQADKGITLTPAFRGTCYFVFDDIPLDDFGNRIPSFSMLVTSNPSSSFPSQTTTVATVSTGAEHAIITNDGQFYITPYADEIVEFVSNTAYDVVQTIILDQVSQGDGPIKSAHWTDINSDGDFSGYIQFDNLGFDHHQGVIWDSDGKVKSSGRTTTGTSVNPYEGGQQFLGPVGNEVLYNIFGDTLSNPGLWIIAGHIGPENFGFGQQTGHVSDNVNAADSDGLELNDFTGESATLDGRLSQFTVDNDGDVWCGVATFGRTRSYLVQVRWPTAQGLQSIQIPTGWTIHQTQSSKGTPISFEPTTNSLFWPGTDGVVEGIGFYSLTDTTFDFLAVAMDQVDTYSVWRNYTKNPSIDGRLIFESGTASAAREVNLITREVGTHYTTLVSDYGLSGTPRGYFYDQFNNAIIGQDSSRRFSWLFLDRNDGGDVTDKVIVDDISTRLNYDVSTEIVSTALTKVREGYIVSRTLEGRKVLEPLSSTGFWISAEIDHQILYVNRGGAIDKTIMEDDLGAFKVGSSPIEKLSEEKMDLFDLTLEVAVHYLDPLTDYQASSQSFKRSSEVVPTRKKVNVNTPLVMTTTDAIQTAQKFVQEAWTSRVKLSFKLTWEHIDVAPGSVLSVMSDGTTFEVFVLNVSYDANGVVTVEGITDHSPAFTGTAPGQPGDIPDNPLLISGSSFFEVMDVPLAQDGVDGIGNYVVGSSFGQPTSDWPGVLVKKAPDLTTYSLSYTFIPSSRQITWGRTTGILASGPLYLFDNDSFVNVDFVTGTMTSVTETQLLNGSNFLAISSSTGVGWEYLQAATITVESDGTLTLRKFLRGKRNTENSISGHSVGDTVLLMQVGNVSLHAEDSGSIGSKMKFQGITLGSDTGTTQTIDSFVANSFKPYSPYNPIGSITADDWNLSWTRRTRIGGAWPNKAWSGLPISQTDSTIEYEVDVFNGSVIVRTITDVASANSSVVTASTDSAFYDDADQTADFGSPQTTLTIKVYQVDTLVGRGEPVTVTLTG